ncbi:MAG: DegT/DnrJ/EryC1/StrS family aminotransferase [Oscillospiraceae bacterium]|nr:DegT/DnrJ/EryC1/StrS family aminotransferase [Oscillospiraceae bacterium]
MPINVTRSSMPSLEDYVEEIKPIFESHILTNMGPVYKKLQAQLKSYLGVPELSLFVNGHLALEMAIQALGLQEKGKAIGGGEVITTPFTFVSTTHAISRNGLTPVFCDIRRDDYCIDADRIEELITPRTVAIIPVHVYGNICDVDKIERIAEKHGLKVIYDGAHAFGEKYRGTGVGCFGDATMFSFHATKVFNSIEGGAVAFKDQRYRDPLHELKNFGIHDQDSVPAIGGNAKLDEFRAAMGICNLRRMDVCVASRRAVYDRYFDRLDGVEGIVLCRPQEGVESNYAYFPVYFDKGRFGKNRDEVFADLEKHDIHTRKYFYPAINEMECYRDLRGVETPVAHDAAMNILTLPIYEELSLEDVDRICDVVLDRAN